jgi:CxxC motif-containing protein
MSITPKTVLPIELTSLAYKYEATPEEVLKWKINVDVKTGEHFIHTTTELKEPVKRGDYIIKDFFGTLAVLTERQYKECFREV